MNIPFSQSKLLFSSQGLIDDGEIEEDESDGGNSDSSRAEKRKKRSEDELSENLEDDDYDLLEENLGVKVQRRVRIKCRVLYCILLHFSTKCEHKH